MAPFLLPGTEKDRANRHIIKTSDEHLDLAIPEASRTDMQAREMVQQLKVLEAQPNGLNSISRTQKVE